jgi:multiple sugar transport system substrate-binding protein
MEGTRMRRHQVAGGRSFTVGPVVLSWILVAGCGDSDSLGINADQAPVTIRLQGHDNASFRRANEGAFADYHAAHPNVTIEATAVDWFTWTTALNADLPRDQYPFDLILMPPSVVCGFGDHLTEVPSDVVSLSEAQNTFFGAPLQGATCTGVLRGLPVEYNLEYGGVIVNVDRYQAKFPGKTPGWATWADFIREASELAEFDGTGKPCVNGLDIDTDWPEPVRHIFLSQILQRGGQYWSPRNDGTFTFDTPEAHGSLAAMVSWIVDDHIMSPKLIPKPDENTFVTGRLAKGAAGYGCTTDLKQPLSIMGYVGTWGIPDTLNQVPANSTTRYEYFALPPMIGDQHKFVQNSGFAFVVPKSSRNPRVAWDIAKSIALSPDAMRKWTASAGTLPALRANGTASAVASDPVLARIQPLLEHGQWMGYIPSASTAPVLGAMVSNFFAVVRGEKSLDQALLDMETKANQSIAQNR